MVRKYLVEDIVDGWRLKRNWYWRNHWRCTKILRKARKGTEIIYVREIMMRFGVIAARIWRHWCAWRHIQGRERQKLSRHAWRRL